MGVTEGFGAEGRVIVLATIGECFGRPSVNEGIGTRTVSLPLPMRGLAVPAMQPELVDLQSLLDPNEVPLDRHLVLRRTDSRRVLCLYGQPLLAWEADDKDTERTAIALVAHQKMARQAAIAAAFEVDRTTVWRLARAWADEGVRGVELKKRGPKGPRVAQGRCRQQIVALGRRGFSRRAIARQLGLAPHTVRTVFRQEGLGAHQTAPEFFGGPAAEAPAEELPAAPGAAEPEEPTQPEAAAEPEASPAAPLRVDDSGGPEWPRMAMEPEAPAPAVGPGDGAPPRDLERVLARAHLLEEAEPQFASGPEVPCAGVLLALALVSRTALFEVAARVYGRLRPAFYGLRNLLRVLFVMALLRVKRTEGLAGRPPEALGRVVGLDRFPEVKTLRRKLNEIAAQRAARQFGAGMAKAWADAAADALGFLLVDGHVRVYSGTRPIPKGYDARRRLATRAVTDYWVNDAEGQPLFVVTSPTNAHLTEVLPEVLAEAQRTVGDRTITVVFDRGGWKPKLFRQLRDAGFHLLTYRKGKGPRVPATRFTQVTGTIDGRELDYRLADGHTRLAGFGRMRRVAIERRDDGQTHILTTREDLPALHVAYHMFGRWRQENFFKYMIQHFELDALVSSYATQPDDPEREVPNPARRELSRQRAKARRDLKALEADLGRLDAPALPGAKPPNRSRTDLLADIERQRGLVARLLARLHATPRRLPLKDVAAEGGPVLLEDERKRFTDVVKLAAYRVESELVALATPAYPRHADEGRALVREMMHTAGDLEAGPATLTVRLRPLSAPRHTAAMAAVCEELNARNLHYPGTHLVLKFAVKDAACCR